MAAPANRGTVLKGIFRGCRYELLSACGPGVYLIRLWRSEADHFETAHVCRGHLPDAKIDDSYGVAL